MNALAFDPRLGELLKDSRWIIGKLPIVGTDGKTRLFNRPFPEQVNLINALCEPGVIDVVDHKPRQVGHTTTNCAHTFSIPYKTADAVSTLIATNHGDTTDSVFSKIKLFVEGLPPELADVHDWRINHSKRSFVSDTTGARIGTLTMGGTSEGRSGTWQRVVGEEVAFWPHPEAGWASVTSTIHQTEWTQFVLISTANKPMDFFHKRVISANKAMQRGDPTVRFVFSRWADHATYRLEPPPSFRPSPEDFALMQLHGLDLQQIYWRHQKIHGVKGISEAQFKREYPLTPEEAFLTLDGSFFDVEFLNQVLNALPEDGPRGRLRIYREPDPRRTYAAGVDPSWCTGNDESVMVIADDRRRVCAILAMNRPDLDTFIDASIMLLRKYRARGEYPLTLVEYNTGGGGVNVYNAYQKAGVPMWQGGRKWKTTGSREYGELAGSKRQALGDLRQMVNGDAWTLNDITLVQQLLHMREEKNRIEGQDGWGDDHVMALAILEQCIRALPTVETAIPTKKRDWRRMSPLQRVHEALQ